MNLRLKLRLCNVRIKHCLYRYYLLPALLLLIACPVLIAVFWGSEEVARILITIAGGLFSFIFFLQRQQHREMKSFKELFAEFNQRYDKLNEKLNRIADESEDQELTSEDKQILYDYFNLCGEEYLFFKKGYIYPEVWKAWCNGILIYLDHSKICRLWKQEEATESYYDLTLDTIKKWAGSPTPS